MTKVTYKEAGVDVAVSDKAKENIKGMVRSTFSKNVLKDIGLFGGFYELDIKKLKQPVLVTSIDGIGTKIKIAQMMGIYHTIGEDLVNHCVNDLMVCGAEPIFFLDYLAADKLNIEIVQEIVQGISRACKNNTCVLIGGETAEMPGVYAENNWDIAGAIVGLVEKNAIIDGSKIQAGDALIGITSNGLHTNGYSLARKIFFEIKNYNVNCFIEETQSTLGEELLRPHRSYQNLINKTKSIESLHGISHITGGGIVGNTKRLLRKNLDLKINWSAWEVPPIFHIIKREGKVLESEMRNVFNLGIGLILIVKEESTDEFLNLFRENREESYVIGSIIPK
ncbi:MAG: phosphoribosylformylglycinamidine cyclo-ligase [bacterium]